MGQYGFVDKDLIVFVLNKDLDYLLSTAYLEHGLSTYVVKNT